MNVFPFPARRGELTFAVQPPLSPRPTVAGGHAVAAKGGREGEVSQFECISYSMYCFLYFADAYI